MKNKKQKPEKKEAREIKTLAFSQILILIIATIAFSWMIGSQVKEVSAAAAGSDCEVCVTSSNTIFRGTIDADGITCKADTPLSAITNCGTDGCNPITNKCNPPQGGESCGDGGICTNQNLCMGGGRSQISGTCNKIGEVCCKDSPSEEGGFGDTVKELGKDIAINEAEKKIREKGFGKKIWKGVKNLFKKHGERITTGASAGGIGFGGIFATVLLNAAAAFATAIGINALAKEYFSGRNAGSLKTFSWLAAIAGTAGGTAVVLSLPGVIGAGAATSLLLGSGAFAGMFFIGGVVSAVIVIAAMAMYMLVGFQEYAREIVTYRVKIWQPQTENQDCETCNSLTLGTGEGKISACSEYVCHSYGAACMFLTDEEGTYETCVEDNPGDTSPPVITPVKKIYGVDVFPNNNYDYKTSAAAAKIIYTGGGTENTQQCIPAFTPVTLAFKTNERAQCKVSLEQIEAATEAERAEKFSNMYSLAEGNAYEFNHTTTIPSSMTASEDALAAAGLDLNNRGNFEFYIRCMDAHGNINVQDYKMSFCVQEGPEMDPPEITATDPADGTYIKYGTSFIEDFKVYTSEPADCKWDTVRKHYDYMTNNFISCSQNLNEPLDGGFTSGCVLNLTGIQNGVENKFYIACKDKPELKDDPARQNERNVCDPYEVTLIGTDQLVIEEVTINEQPNASIFTSSDTNFNANMAVTTSGGAEDGGARCMYSVDKGVSYPPFTNGGNVRDYYYVNTNEMYLTQGGVYNILIKCYDVNENIAETMLTFTIDIDNTPPIVVRIYKDGDNLRLITNEVARCVYSINSCIYNIEEDGTQMDRSEDGKEHFTPWDSTKDLYIKCMDELGNAPDDVCSIVARPFEIREETTQ